MVVEPGMIQIRAINWLPEKAKISSLHLFVFGGGKQEKEGMKSYLLNKLSSHQNTKIPDRTNTYLFSKCAD